MSDLRLTITNAILGAAVGLLYTITQKLTTIIELLEKLP